MLLLNYAESTSHNKPIEKDMEKHKYEQAVSECKKWRSLIKKVSERNINFLKKKYQIISGLNMEKW